MKIKFYQPDTGWAFAVFLLFSSPLCAQTSFSGVKVIHEPDTKGIIGVYSADLDGDTLPDVLTASYLDNKIAWYKNTGAGLFSKQIIISTSITRAIDVIATDLDLDGDADVLAVSAWNNNITWFLNDGLGNFSAPATLATGLTGIFSIVAADLDLDGDTDILAASNETGDIIWYANNGSGAFGPKQTVYHSTDIVKAFLAADLDNDNQPDIAASLYDASINHHKLVWFQNQGSGTFAPPLLIGMNNISTICTGDVDNDGDNDLAVSGTTTAWYENDGTGNFGPEQVIEQDGLPAYSIAIGDLNDDAYPDIVTSSYDGGYLTYPPMEYSRIAWFQNQADGAFSPAQILSTSAYGENEVIVADLNTDGTNDVLSCSSLDHKLAWYPNSSPSGFETGQLINDPVSMARKLMVTDANGDGYPDVVASYSTPFSDTNHIGMAWYPNNGDAFFDQQYVIDHLPWGVDNFDIADLNGDALPDIVETGMDYSTHAVTRWYPNGGTGGWGTSISIAVDTSREKVLLMADLDTDGDNDIVSTYKIYVWGGIGYKSLVWRINDGSGHFSPPQTIIEEVFPRLVSSFDPDGDGDTDLLFTVYNNNIIFLIENTGNGTWASVQQIQTEQEILFCQISDMDGDTDEDICIATNKSLYWHENTGSWQFGAASLIKAFNNNIAACTLVDLDHDGDQDIAFSVWGETTMKWLERIENEQCIVHTIGSAERNANTLYIAFADLDSDNDQDVLVSLSDGSILWFENTTVVPVKNVADPSLPILVCPNPSTGETALLRITRSEKFTDTPYQLCIFNTQGQLVHSRESRLHAEETIVLPDLPTGAYWVVYASGRIQQAVQWLVQ